MGWVPMNTIMRAELAGKEATGTVIAVGATVGSVGSIFGPPLFGYLTDSFSSFRPAWLLLACLGVLAFLLTWTVKEARSPD
jgi:MFS family permease